jgi:hypothetical protein
MTTAYQGPLTGGVFQNGGTIASGAYVPSIQMVEITTTGSFVATMPNGFVYNPGTTLAAGTTITGRAFSNISTLTTAAGRIYW